MTKQGVAAAMPRSVARVFAYSKERIYSCICLPWLSIIDELVIGVDRKLDRMGVQQTI